MYQILPYTRQRAKRLKLIIQPSTRKGKKIDVYDKNYKYITSVGDSKYLDYPTYLKYYGTKIANERKRLYKIRHKKDRSVKYSRGWFADYLLW